MEPLIEIAEADEKITLADAKKELLSKCDEGVRCPCCEAYTQAYRRSITSSMAIGLTYLVKNYEVDEPIRLEQFYMDVIEQIKVKRTKKGKEVEESIIPRGSRGNIPALRFWGLLIQIDEETRPDGNKDGNYVLTQKAFDFVHKKIKLPKYAVLYNGEFKGFEGDDIEIGEAFTKKFNLYDLIDFPKEEKKLEVPLDMPAKEPIYPVPEPEEDFEEIREKVEKETEFPDPSKCTIESMGWKDNETYLIADYTREGKTFFDSEKRWKSLDEAIPFKTKEEAESILNFKMTG